MQLGLPVTPLVPRVSAFLKPEKRAVKLGLGSPYSRDPSSAVTVSVAWVTVRFPATIAKV